MNTYLVGGAVRDELLGLPIKEMDWVVVGATPEQMLKQGFQQVGKDFPVFLHPDTKEEYALARTERKSGQGYTGFTCHSSPDVTLEEDLMRRDLTINAIAKSSTGEIIDPYGGQKDLEHRLLRHVSVAFAEDPLRVLRIARFKAKLHHLGFTIAEETQYLLISMVQHGELTALIPERVWLETEKALATDNPHIYFHTLREIGALEILYPELDKLFGIPSGYSEQPYIDIGMASLKALQSASQQTDDIGIRFAALTYALGSAECPPSAWLVKTKHAEINLKPLNQLRSRYRLPNHIFELAKIVAQNYFEMLHVNELGPNEILNLLEKFDAYRRPERFEKALLACRCVIPKAKQACQELAITILTQAYQTTKDIKFSDNTEKLTGPEIGQKLRELKIQELTKSISFLSAKDADPD